jgi:5-methyltetrahydrofolate--homocysteine methyltransferase
LQKIVQLLKNKILVLDGGMGTMIQDYHLGEIDYRGGAFLKHKVSLFGNHDILSLTRPDVIKEIHYQYLLAGSDIIETNTLNANAISQSDYGLEEIAYEMNKQSALLARQAVDEYSKEVFKSPKFVAGSVGPTTKLLSISPDVSDPSFRNITFDELQLAYETQIKGLLDGGVDLLLIETAIDSLNVKAALVAAEGVFKKQKKRLPIMVSATISDKGGRILSGQTVEAFFHSVKTRDVFSVGLNCSFGAKELIPVIKKVSEKIDLFMSVYPNAGFKNVMGEFDEKPKTTASLLAELIDGGYVNIVGGCCGTTPEHISEISRVAQGKNPRKIPETPKKTIYCGLETLTIEDFPNIIGERTNVAGSKKFAKLICEKKYEEALNIARQQVELGARVIDVNFDDGMLDGKLEMAKFLKMIASEPEIAKVPIMIDSSSFEVLEVGLKSIQGKHIVNSISLKEGEEEFIKKAEKIKVFGAAVVVMAFDEKGQAETFDRKIEVCKRAYDILVHKVDFSPQDIILDPNILTIATGMEEHKNFAVDYLKAVEWISENLPYAKTSGGLSNCSFSFRGNTEIREMIHAVFLHHARKFGLSMVIANPLTLKKYEDIPHTQRKLVENVIFNQEYDAEERLLVFAKTFLKQSKNKAVKAKEWREKPLSHKIPYTIIHGISEFLEVDMAEALKTYQGALQIVEGPLMDGMNEVGKRFGEGEMFLPQVIKSARVMKRAVEILRPYLERESRDLKGTHQGRVLLATVKGDVHDIGKNIVGVVLRCNNFEVIDLGIMVPVHEILSKAKELDVDIIGLSGLITPSLYQMVEVAKGLEKHAFHIPLMIGGAPTSKLHTALKIAPKYKEGVVYVRDASESVKVCKKLMGDRKVFIEGLKEEYAKVRAIYHGVHRKNVSLTEARRLAPQFSFTHCRIKPRFVGVKVMKDFSLNEVREYIDWTSFFTSFDMRKSYPDIFEDDKYGIEAKKLYKEANQILDTIQNEKSLTLNAVLGIFPANSIGDDIVIYEDEERKHERLRFHTIRRQEVDEEMGFLSLADFVAPTEIGVEDYLGAFVATAGIGCEGLVEIYEKKGDTYSGFLVKMIADRLVEAFSEKLHEILRKETWGYEEKQEQGSFVPNPLRPYRGIRPAIGYPSMPDHSEKLKLSLLLEFEKQIGVELTSSFMMNPAASVCGLYFSHPEAKYFDVGKIFVDGLKDYAKRKGWKEEWIKELLGNRVYEKA